ncbi:MAG: hypothetical protein OIN66_07930 [Candidatus Methanoperedens sp.]|nr:hypothetical protein [Candidatus Methanoperedens sp.]
MLSEIFEQVRSQRKKRLAIRPEPFWLYQFKKLVPTLSIVYVLTLSILFIVVTIHQQTKTSISDLTRDPASVMGAPFYVGLLSNIGILLWSASAAICLFCSAVLRKDTNNRELPLFLLFSGIITSIFLLDDLFFFHENIYPAYFNVSEKTVYLAYAIIVSLYLVRFRVTIFGTEFLLLLFAFVFFGLSVILGMKLIDLPASYYLFKDGAKLFGIVTWSTYFTRIGLRHVKHAILFRQQGFAYD